LGKVEKNIHSTAEGYKKDKKNPALVAYALSIN